jgi:hypothetical protein
VINNTKLDKPVMTTITLEIIGSLSNDSRKRLQNTKNALLIEILNNILKES